MRTEVLKGARDFVTKDIVVLKTRVWFSLHKMNFKNSQNYPQY